MACVGGDVFPRRAADGTRGGTILALEVSWGQAYADAILRKNAFLVHYDSAKYVIIVDIPYRDPLNGSVFVELWRAAGLVGHRVRACRGRSLGGPSAVRARGCGAGRRCRGRCARDAHPHDRRCGDCTAARRPRQCHRGRERGRCVCATPLFPCIRREESTCCYSVLAVVLFHVRAMSDGRATRTRVTLHMRKAVATSNGTCGESLRGWRLMCSRVQQSYNMFRENDHASLLPTNVQVNVQPWSSW